MDINNIPLKENVNPVVDNSTQVSAEEFNSIVDTVKKAVVNKLGTTSRNDEMYITQKLAGGTDVLETQLPKATTSTPGIMSKDDKSNLNKAVKNVSPRFGDPEKVYIDIEFVDKDAEVINIEKATQQAAGVMSAEDKKKLDNLSPAENYPLVSQTINGDSYNIATDETESLTLYAPTEPGPEGYILASTGSGAPQWIPQADIKAGDSDHAGLADSATKASQDSMGRVISDTYLTKEEAGDINTYNEVRHLINGKEYKVATTDPSSNNVTIYAPTDDGGNSGYLLQSGGTGNAPTWADPADFTVGSANYATRDSLGNIIKDTYVTQNDISDISSTAQEAKTLAEQANQNVALQQGAIDSLEEQLANIGETGVATSAEQVTFKVGTTGLTKVNVQGALEEVAGKLTTALDPDSIYDTDKGVKVALKGTVSSPSVDVTTTLGVVDANNSGLVSGASVKAYVDSLKSDLVTGEITVDQATMAKQLGNYRASSYAKKDDTIYASKESNGVTVTLDGTVGSPTIDVSVNGGAVTNGSSSIVNANDVYNFVNSAISNQDTFTSNKKGLVPASTNTSAYLKGDGTWSTPKDATVSQTLQNTANAEYPLLLGAAGQSATKTGGVYFDSNITVNPNTNTITATTFKGKASNAVKADSADKATQDGNGSEIASSYVKKGTLATVATTGSYNDLSSKPSNATTAVAGFMSASDKTKLDSLSKDVATANANGLMSATDKAKFNTISTWYDGITGTDSDDVINKWSEVTSFLSGIKDTNTLNSLIGAVDTKVGTLKSDIQNGTVVANKSTVATKVGTSTVGSATQPVYLSGGAPSVCTYSLNKTVPSDAVFTDTHHTAKNVVSNSANATANKAATNGNVHINLVENNTCRSGIKIVGSGATTVSSDANGNITILSNDTNTTYVAMTGATSTANGKEGLVPKPLYGSENAFLRGDGTWSYRINEFGHTGAINIGTGFSYATGWFRIARARYSRSTPSVFRVAIYRNYSYGVPEAYVFDVCTSYHNNDPISITQVAGQASTINGNKLIDKIRVTRDTSSTGTILYFDFHVNTSVSGNQFYWYVIGNADSYKESEVVHNPTITSTTETHEFTTVNGFKTNGNIYEGDSSLSEKYIQTTKGISTSGSSKGVKVALGGTVGSPTISVETTPGSVASNNSGVVSGAAVKEYVDANKGVSTVFKAQTSSSNAVNGLVPAPSSANASKYLRGDGTWQTPTITKDSVTSALGYTPAKEVPNTMVWGGILNTAAYATDYAVGTVLKVATSESLSILKEGSLITSSLASGTNVIVSHESYMSGSSYNSGKVFVIF